MTKNKQTIATNPNFKVKYEAILPELKKNFGFSNNMEAPIIEKIVVNVGIGSTPSNEVVESIKEDLKKITGQSPVFTVAKKAISGLKVREGQKVGIKVTLRGKRMWEFLERMIVSALPRVKDFQGVSLSSFDTSGSCSVGFKEHIVFPEINADEVKNIFGLQVCIVIKRGNKESGKALLVGMGFPISKDK